jgi:tetratricopeptide (TPR) repeat protein/transglutaminase-like putative cysteine protease
VRQKSSQKSPAKILRLKVSYVLDDKGNYVRTLEQTYQILTLQGVEGWSNSFAFWSPWYMDRPQLEAVVRGEDGSVSKLEPKTIVESAAYPEAPDMYSDAKVLRAPLPSVAVGSIVEERIVERTKSPFFLGGSIQSLTFQQGVPVDSVELSVELPARMPFKYELRDVKAEVTDRSVGTRRMVVFKGGPYEALKPIEPNVPSDVPAWPQVVFSTAPSWKELAREYHRRIEERFGGPPTGIDLKKVVLGLRTTEEKLNRLLSFIHDRVRYVGMEFGEASIIPMAPKETLRRGYGDCKDQSVLLVKLLSEIGIDAKVALLRAGTGEDVRPELPALNAFNHAIVYVPGEKPLWVDPTSTHARAGELPTAAQARHALIIDPSTDTLTETAAHDASQNVYREEREVFLSVDGGARIVETSSGTGVVDQSLRRSFSQDESALRKSLKEYVEGTYQASELGTLTVPTSTDIERPFEIKLEAKGAKVATLDLLQASIALELKPLFSWIPNEAYGDEPRKMDFVVHTPFVAELRYRIRVPDEFVVKNLQKPADVDLGPVVLSRSLQTTAKDVVESIATLTVKSRRWTPSQLERFRKGVEKLSAQSRMVVKLEHKGQQLIEAHRVREGLELFRNEQQKHPKSGVHAMRLALNLVDLGFGDAARDLALQSVVLEPNNATLHRNLGVILCRDEFGRMMQRGYDRERAAAAYKRAAELDEGDMFSRVQAALVYEYDLSGRRYADTKSLETAIKLYDAMDPDGLAAYDDGGYANNPLFALLWAKRYDALSARLATLPDQKVPGLLAAVSSTMQSDANAGLATVDRLGLRGEDRSQVLANSAEVLVQLRRYPEAARLVGAAASGSANSVQYEGRARFLEKLKLTDLSRLPENDASSVVQKVLLVGFAPDATQADYLVKLLTSEALKKTSNVNETLKTLATTAQDNKDTSPEVLTDVMRAMMRFDVQGDDSIGYRVKVRSEAPGVQSSRFDAFVVKDHGQYRLRAFGDGLSELGQQAFEFLKNNRRKAAETWLKWASENVSSPGGDDPLRTIPWLRIWKSGKGSVELAAAALCLNACGSEGTTLLEAARAKATGVEAEELDQALAMNYVVRDEPRKLLEVANRLLASHPKSLVARRWKRVAFFGLKDYLQLKAHATKELDVARDDELGEVYRSVSDADAALGNVKEARATLGKLIELGRADAQTYGNYAWYDLVLGSVTDRTLEYASRAVQMTDFGTVNLLHTLAAVYAELGKTEEAKQTLDKLFELRPGKTPAAVDFYVIGRLAESFALVPIAQKSYQRVSKPKEDGPTSTYRLAQARLRRLK